MGCASRNRLLSVVALAMAASSVAVAETRVTYKSAKATSSYYQMAVQIAEAVKQHSGGAISLTVEESQGSVQNVKEAAVRQGNYVFTTPPALVGLAQKGEGKFSANPAYGEIRALFPIPSLTMHFVLRSDREVVAIAELEGKSFLIGKGSFGAREAAKYLDLFGLKGKVELVDAELNAAVPALKNRQIDGFATAGSYPAPNVMEAAAGTKIAIVSLSEEQVAETKRTKIVIPAGTYPGVNVDVTTTSLPVLAYTTSAMDEETAYGLTKAFWESKSAMGATNPWWNGVTPALLETTNGKIHAGALRYYDEANIAIANRLR